MSAKLISIIGPIGVGKTTLAEALAAELPAETIYEDYASNPFLADSYTGCDELLLPSQLFFLNSRAAQMNRVAWPTEGLYVSDYGFCQDPLFARAKLTGEDLRTYEFVLSRLSKLIHPPAVIVHLDAAVDTLWERICKRGRKFEEAFSREFLETMRAGHYTIELPEGCELLRVDCDAVDLRQPASRAELIEQIRGKL